MSLNYPSNPLNAQDAKLISDKASLEAQKVATDAWLTNANSLIMAAANAGNYSISIGYDNTVNLDSIVNKLSTVLGYTVTNLTSTKFLNINWQSVVRDKTTPDSNPGSNFGFEQPNSN